MRLLRSCKSDEIKRLHDESPPRAHQVGHDVKHYDAHVVYDQAMDHVTKPAIKRLYRAN